MDSRSPRAGTVLLAYVAFIALGMPDSLLGVAWPSIRSAFAIPIDAVGFLLAAVVTGYLISSSTAGPVMARVGVGKVLAASCAVTGAGLIGYTLVPAWWMMVLLGILAGLGAGAIDAGLNAYAAENFGERLMQWMHASYGIGITLGPFIMTTALASMGSWRAGYDIVGGFQIVLAGCFIATLSLWSTGDRQSDNEQRITEYKTSLAETLRQGKVWLSMLLFFVYTGCEFTLGTWAYSLLVESRGIGTELAGIWVGGYYAVFTVGRIVAGLYIKKVGVHRAITGNLTAALVGSAILWWNPASIANLAAIALIGFAIAPIFPAMVSGTNDRVGAKYAANTIGMQMAAAALGGTAFPSLAGILARHTSLDAIPVVLLALFAGLITAYAWALTHGSKREAVLPG